MSLYALAGALYLAGFVAGHYAGLSILQSVGLMMLFGMGAKVESKAAACKSKRS